MSNLNTLSAKPGEVYNTLLKTAQNQINEVSKPMSIMLWGRPGIGKTQMVEQLAKNLGAMLFDVRLTTIDTSDLRGLPYYDHETKTTQWYRPEDLPNVEQPTILFLDELSSAPQHIQPTVYGLLQERRVGKHKLPKNCIVIAAGNGVADGAVAYEMGTAIANRLVHIHVVSDAEDWIKNFAVPFGLHPAVVAFVKTRPDLLENTKECMDNEQQISATPRSWERVSEIMKNYEDRVMQRLMVAGSVGQNIAADFMSIADEIAGTVKVDDMLKVSREERLKMVPKTLHGLHAMAFGLTGLVNSKNLKPIWELINDVSKTDEFIKTRNEPEFKKMPLSEIMAYIAENILIITQDPKRNSEGKDLSDIAFEIDAFNEYLARHEELVSG